MDMKKVLLIVAVLAGCLWAASACMAAGDCCKDTKGASQCKPAVADASKDPTAQSVVIDPVCGMDVEVKDAKFSCEYKDKKYYFCSESCMKKFGKDPSKYIGKGAK